MTPDEQAASSIRYIAPRVVLLDSGLFALIDMMGEAPPAILNAEALIYAIPTESELCTQYNQLSRPKPKPKPSTLTLEELGL